MKTAAMLVGCTLLLAAVVWPALRPVPMLLWVPGLGLALWGLYHEGEDRP